MGAQIRNDSPRRVVVSVSVMPAKVIQVRLGRYISAAKGDIFQLRPKSRKPRVQK